MLTLTIAFVVLWLVLMVWIAVDNDLGGANHIIWLLRSAKTMAWPARFYWMIGWRFVVLRALQLGLLAAVVQFCWAAAAVGWPVIAIVGVVVVAALAFAFQHRELHPYFEWQRRKRARRICRQLSATGHELEQARRLDELTTPADYLTHQGWQARHPCEVDQWTSDIVPVAYVRPSEPRSVIFPIDFECFVAWNLPGDFPRRGANLPFEGPSDSTFRLRNIVNVRGCPGWTLLHARLNLKNDLLLAKLG